MARTHGWSGNAPSDDEAAVRRIVRAAGELIDEGAVEPTILHVAKRLGVTRQTIYRYFTSTEELWRATAEDATTDFLADLAEHMRGITDPAEAVVEGVARTLENLRANRRFGLFFRGPTPDQILTEVTSTTAITLGRALLDESDVQWDGWGDDDRDELVEHMLRTLQSFIIDPGHPPRTGAQLRAYLRRWIAPACGPTTAT